MLHVVGSARNITGLLVDGIEKPVACVEVVLVCTKPVYGFTKDEKLVKVGEVADVRFSASPRMLRYLAEQFENYADQAEDAFGSEPEPDDIPEGAGTLPNPAPAEAGTPSKPFVEV
jgi:hypothetical protein